MNDSKLTASVVNSSYKPMYLKPIVLPLNVKDVIYLLQDERGKLISAGSREVCELLLHTLNKEADTCTREVAWFINDAAINRGM